MAATGKRIVPVELLRRSSRLTRGASTSKQESHIVSDKKQPIKVIGQSGRKNPDLKRFKTDELKDAAGTELRHQKPRKSTTSNNIDAIQDVKPIIATNKQPDGFVSVHADELDLERTLLGGQSFRWTKEENCDDGQTQFFGIVASNALNLWRCDQNRIAFKILNKETVDSQKVANLLEDYFQLKYKLRDLYQEWSAKDKHLEKCCKRYKGFRILRQDPVENVFSFICATNNNIKRISQMIDKLCKRFGEVIEGKCQESYQIFPTIERLAKDDVFQCLRYELGFGYRAKFICETAKRLMDLNDNRSSGHLAGHNNKSARDFLLSLRSLPYKETCKELMQFPGVGRKVADCICLMSMDHLGAVPIDCHIYEIVCRNYMPKLRQERKTLTESVHNLIGDYFNRLHGPLAGWSTSVLFISELRHLKLAGDKQCEKVEA